MSNPDPLIPRSLPPAPGWTRLDSQAEADQLVDSFDGFHDSVIKELYLDSRAGHSLPRLRVLFHGPSVLELYFYDLKELTGITDQQSVIDEASLDWTPKEVAWRAGHSTLIRSAVVLWRQAPDWTGPQNHYMNPNLDLAIADPLSLYLYE